MKTKSPINIAFAQNMHFDTHFYVNKFYMVHTINLTNLQKFFVIIIIITVAESKYVKEQNYYRSS